MFVDFCLDVQSCLFERILQSCTILFVLLCELFDHVLEHAVEFLLLHAVVLCSRHLFLDVVPPFVGGLLEAAERVDVVQFDVLFFLVECLKFHLLYRQEFHVLSDGPFSSVVVGCLACAEVRLHLRVEVEPFSWFALLEALFEELVVVEKQGLREVFHGSCEFVWYAFLASTGFLSLCVHGNFSFQFLVFSF